MPRKIKVVDIPTVEETVFETAREEDAKEDDVKEDEIKDDYIDTKEEASKQDDLIPIPNSVIEEAKNDKPQKELVKCQYCNKSMLGKTLKYSHYQNCQSFKKINKITDKTPKPTEQPPEAPPPPPPPPPPTTITIPKSKPKSKPKPKEIIADEESPTKTIDKPHPRTERMNLIKERYNNLVKNAFNI